MTNGLFPKITFPTRYDLNRNTAALIDHLFCKFIDGKNCISSGILISNISDHLPYFTYIRVKKKLTRKKKTVLVYKNTEESINEFQYDVSNAVNNIAINNDLLGNPNNSYNSLENILMEAKSKHFQPREVRFVRYKHKFSPWISSGIIHPIKYRYSLYRKLKTTDVQTPEYNELSNNLRICNSILKTNIRLAKNEHYAKIIDEYKFNIRRTWSTFNDVLNKHKNRDSFPNFFMIIWNKTNSNKKLHRASTHFLPI